MGRSRMAVVMLALVSVGGACSANADDSLDPSDSAPGAATNEPFPPGTITARATRETECGDYFVEDPLTGDVSPEQECFLDAVDAHEPAVLVVRSTGVEGEPHRTQYRVLDEGYIEVVSDYTRDQFSEGGVSRTVCESIEPEGSTMHPTGCELGKMIDP